MIKEDFTQKIIEAIEDRVNASSKRRWNAMNALNMLIRERFDGFVDPTKAILPNFTNQTFIRQMMLGTKESHYPDADVVDFFQRHPSYISNEKRYLGDRNIYSAAATNLVTNIKTHLVANFPRVLKKYLYDVSAMLKDDAVDVFYKVHGWKPRNTNVPKKEVEEKSKKIRYILGIEDGDTITPQWLKGNVISILRMFVFINRCLERKDLPLFNILPLCKIKAHCITMDSYVFFGIMKDVGLATNIHKDLERDFWHSVFNIKSIIGRGKSFTGTIDTDGVVANVHFQKPKLYVDDSDNETFKKKLNLEDKRVIGVDPGRTNIFHMVEQLDDGSFKEYKLTRKQYYNESGINDAIKRSIHWNIKLKSELHDLSMVSPKSTRLDKYILYRDALIKNQESLWTEYLKKHWRQQKFRLYGGKKRVFAKFLNRLGPLEKTVLAYGSAKFAPGGRGELCVPTSRAFKECSYRVRCILVDEFRTSKIHWRDDSILEKVQMRKKDGGLKTVRGLLWCSSTNQERGKFINRDLNAAINILRCVTLPTRPKSLKRDPNKKKIVQRVGKIINC